MILDRLDRWASYGLDARLEAAFRWLEGRSWPDTVAGRHEIDGDRVFAVVSEYATKAQGPLEYHRRYADVQYVAMGSEELEWSPEAVPANDPGFDPRRDIGFVEGRGLRLPLAAGWFAVLLPGELHAPGLDPRTGTSAVLKAVVKVLLND